ncbi:MAG TPA: ABC transporter ATP-binding protein [Bryobacteraceae bacterium]|nr:ABC transporter ATP-binding protein [Bryobacteraceae bacterium]
MIACRNLTKRFGDFTAVDGVTFEVAKGAICAVLGPNGAGKSTTVKLLTALLTPTAGEAKVAGLDVRNDRLALKRAIGVLPEDLGLFDSLTVAEHLDLAGPIYGLSRSETRARSGQLLTALGLENASDTFADECSYGMRKKTALALALLHNPQVLFLDEPFEGIDPVTSKTIRDILTSVAAKGVTVMLTSHILTLVEQIATQIVLIRQGRVVWNSTRAELPGSLEELYLDLVEPPRTPELPWLGS